MKRKTACSPAIWKKLSETEKRWWTRFYRDFMGEMKINSVLTISQKEKTTIAHNNACLAVWAMRITMDRVFKALKGPASK